MGKYYRKSNSIQNVYHITYLPTLLANAPNEPEPIKYDISHGVNASPVKIKIRFLSTSGHTFSCPNIY